MTPDALMLVVPSDHVIADVEPSMRRGKGAEAARVRRFRDLRHHARPARDGLWLSRTCARPEDGAAVALKSFREKPDLDRQAMLAAGGYLWNAGIFLMRVGDLIAAFETHAPDLVGPAARPSPRGGGSGLLPAGAEAYGQARAISFDYAIMERAERVMAVPLTSGWSDLGAWDTLWQAAGPDAAGQRH
jgi:mannose-1-phosphate guanylyltransferase/mannose-6-phosphate isomerase